MVLAFTCWACREPRGLHLLPASDRGAVGAGPGRAVGWRRWAAIGVGFVGVLIILQPGFGVFQPAGAIPLLAAASCSRFTAC
jgi:hypothetical protein